ncbi:MAG: formylmethanofuran--tetrahydromethanopterin N-formyltransferase [Candidatus Bathyarchaeota archaeon]|nr:MAG: formylmethanofuran--tetrahydromethanopterin N-formyltransferase [Candidatus Bathyarchaeota archaeon]
MATKLKVKKKTAAGYILENGCLIEDTFAEMFSMWAGRILITAENEKWAMTAARNATGFAASIIASPAEAGIEGILPANKTPDGRIGVRIQMYHRTRRELRNQMISRIGQCVMTCPTTAAFDALPKAKRRLKVGRSLRLFGDGFQKKDTIAERTVWRIPVMEGEFVVESRFGAWKAVAGGLFIIMAENRKQGLHAAEQSVAAIEEKAKGVVLPFPGGICRSGSKVGSQKYKLPASTNHPFCPKLKKLVPDTQVPDNADNVYEIVINGLNLDLVKRAMAEGIKAAVKVPGVIKISADNFGGKLGPFKAHLKEVLELGQHS